MALPKILDRGLQALLLVTAFSAVICAIIWGNFLLPRGQMMWDEAEHVFTGLIFANDMLRLDFPSLAGHAYGQVLWPPLHPLLLSGFFLLFGQGVEAARASSLALYFLFVIAMFFLGKEMASRNKDVSGILCSAFALVTGSLYLSASEAMLEMLALLFFTLSLLSFLRFQKDARMWQAVPVFTLLAFFSKTNFGIALILAYLAHFLIKERLHLERLPRNGDFLRIFLPVLLIILVWMMPPDRLQVFLGSLVNRPEGPPALSAEGLLYYPTQIFIYSGPLLLLYAAALALSFKHLKNEKFRFLVIVALLAILLNLFHQNRKIRYILYLYPPLFSLAAFHLTNLYSRIKQRKKHLLFCLAIAASMAVYAIHLHMVSR
jgi:4-amino-4-deoxy-L-arabinose transferase-like glycosyltransferase